MNMQLNRCFVRLAAMVCLLAPVAALGLSEVHVDIQPASGTTAPGYVAVTSASRWDNSTSADLGGGVRGGWLDYFGAGQGDRGTGYTDPLTRDFVQWSGSNTAETFKVTGLQPGTYNLKIYASDPQYNDKRTRFEIDQDNDTVIDQAVTIETPVGERDKTVSVAVSTAGILTIRINRIGTASGVFCGLDLTSGTPDTTPPAAISSLAVMGQATTQVMLRWTAPADDNGAAGKVASYDVRYSTSAIDDVNWATASQATGEPTPAGAGTQENFTVSGLTASTTYYLAVKSADAANNISPMSNLVSAATPAPDVTAPSAVIDLATSAIGANLLTLTWTASGDDGSVGYSQHLQRSLLDQPDHGRCVVQHRNGGDGHCSPQGGGPGGELHHHWLGLQHEILHCTEGRGRSPQYVGAVQRRRGHHPAATCVGPHGHRS